MSTLKDFEPTRYIDCEAVAQAYLVLARNLGDEAILREATNDVINARKQWLDHRPGGVNVAALTTAPTQ